MFTIRLPTNSLERGTLLYCIMPQRRGEHMLLLPVKKNYFVDSCELQNAAFLIPLHSPPLNTHIPKNQADKKHTAPARKSSPPDARCNRWAGQSKNAAESTCGPIRGPWGGLRCFPVGCLVMRFRRPVSRDVWHRNFAREKRNVHR